VSPWRANVLTPGASGEIADDVGAARAGVLADYRRHPRLEHRRDCLARLLLAARETEVDVEVTVSFSFLS